MINYILSNQHYFAVLFLIISKIANAISDYLIFSEKYKNRKTNHYWHCLKYGVDRPALFFVGLFAAEDVFMYVMLLYQNFYYWLWHYPDEIMIMVAGWMLSFFLWQITYKALKKYAVRL